MWPSAPGHSRSSSSTRSPRLSRILAQLTQRRRLPSRVSRRTTGVSAELAAELLSSLDGPTDPDAEAAWSAEIPPSPERQTRTRSARLVPYPILCNRSRTIVSKYSGETCKSRSTSSATTPCRSSESACSSRSSGLTVPRSAMAVGAVDDSAPPAALGRSRTSPCHTAIVFSTFSGSGGG